METGIARGESIGVARAGRTSTAQAVRAARGAERAVWPTAVLVGGSFAGLAALGAWVAAWSAGLPRPWELAPWVAEHGLWGTLIGGLVALVLGLGARFDPTLADPAERRAAATRLTLLAAGLGFLVVAVRAVPAGAATTVPLGGLVVGAGLWALVVEHRFGGPGALGRRLGIDCVRAAVLAALWVAPLYDGRWGGQLGGGGLFEAWGLILAR